MKAIKKKWQRGNKLRAGEEEEEEEEEEEGEEEEKKEAEEKVVEKGKGKGGRERERGSKLRRRFWEFLNGNRDLDPNSGLKIGHISKSRKNRKEEELKKEEK